MMDGVRQVLVIARVLPLIDRVDHAVRARRAAPRRPPHCARSLLPLCARRVDRHSPTPAMSFALRQLRALCKAN
jgi:hypothetical protein